MSTLSSTAFPRMQFSRSITFSPGRIMWVGLGLICLFDLSGCAAIQVKLGSRVYLAKTPVASIAATLPRGPAIAPEKSRRWSLWSRSRMARYFKRKARAAGKFYGKTFRSKRTLRRQPEGRSVTGQRSSRHRGQGWSRGDYRAQPS